MSDVKQLRIPHMGSVENARLVAWHVAENAYFTAGQTLYEVETDKTLTEVDADCDGYLLKQLAEEDEDFKVGDVVGLFADGEVPGEALQAALQALNAVGADADAIPDASPSAGSTADNSAATPANTAAGAAGGARHSPLVRKLAAEHGINLTEVAGSGPAGRVTKEDILARVAAADAKSPLPAGYEAVPCKTVANSLRRQTIARRLSAVAREVPQLTADMEIAIEHLIEVRHELSRTQVARGEAGISLFSCIAAAVCKALADHPELNATYGEKERYLWQTVNLGIAVDTPDGLVVPVVKDAQRLDVNELNTAIKGLTARALGGSLDREELEGGTFTLSNPGALGPVLRAEAILNPPQVALLGLPATRQVPVAEIDDDGNCRVAVRTVLRPSLTFDHRALDGGHAIRFLNTLSERLADPDWLLD
ncbi:dihydrolipoamide acetyltransferase family protein [Parahaliea mediterranea]|uniref:dihydrolipoamide acetyltransferase family protein n=1 Tax=Parahaliea mediterranea TaxID=651086 RepID=UPI000E2F7AF2|nr:dihydrolipoamide acetyltransferase family protein [Parahaliea mediterranea]